MRQRGIERVCCLLDAPQLGYYPGDLLELYRQAFGALNICHAPVADFTLCPADLLGGVILPFLVESVRLEKKVVVHCSGGIGRTGHVLAAWLVHGRGFEAQAALEAVRFVDGALRNPGEAVEGDRVKQAALLALLEMSRKPAGL
jgi:protein-tyrosine phosphatase